MKPRFMMSLLVASLLLAGCGSSSEASDPAPTTVAPPTTSSPGASVPTLVEQRYPIDHGLDVFVAMAADDLQVRQNVARDEIRVLNAYLVTWPDTSLGCPQPDEVYLQVVTDGSIIELLVDGQVFRYHAGGDLTEPFRCEKPSGDEQVLVDTPLELADPKENYPDETVPPPRFTD